jgi:hypothetical protein
VTSQPIALSREGKTYRLKSKGSDVIKSGRKYAGPIQSVVARLTRAVNEKLIYLMYSFPFGRIPISLHFSSTNMATKLRTLSRV